MQSERFERPTIRGGGYDLLGRKTARYQLTSAAQTISSGIPRASWAYDTVKKGQLTSATRVAGSASYTTEVTAYDAAYRPLGHKVTLPAGLAAGLATSYTYTIDGQLETLTLPSAGDLPAETVRYYYDAANQPEWMGSGRGWGTYVSDTAYSALGQLLQQRMGTTWAYFIGYTYESGTRRLTGTALYRQANAGFSTDVDLTYSYDDYGNPTSVTDTAGTTDRQCFRYDGLGRLTSAWTSATSGCDAPTSWSGIGGPAPYWQTYTYTAVGDRSTVVARTAAGASTSTYTYPASGAPRPHAVTAVTTTGVSPASASFGYDAAGNTTTRSVGTLAAALTWTPEGQLATVDENTSIGVEGTYTYTADGDRLVRVHEGATTVYLPGGQEVTAANGVVSVERTYTFAGRPVATRTGISPTQLWSLVVDPHHSASVAINNGATPGDSTAVVKRRMDPFGNPRGTNPAWPTDKGFLNKPTDATGLTHIGARYYDAAFGRFISVDPIMNLSDPNQWAAYAYANNNPVTNWDPTGLVTYRDGETAGQAQRRQGSGPKVAPSASNHPFAVIRRAQAGFGRGVTSWWDTQSSRLSAAANESRSALGGGQGGQYLGQAYLNYLSGVGNGLLDFAVLPLRIYGFQPRIGPSGSYRSTALVAQDAGWVGANVAVAGATAGFGSTGGAAAGAARAGRAAPGPGSVAANTDPLIEFANANRGSGTRFASEYTSPSGAKYYDVNAARDALPEGHPLSATGHHGGCAEFGCLLQAYEAEGPAAIQGGQMRTVYVRGPESPIPPGPPTGHGAPAAPCGKACQPLLDHLGVDW